MLRELADLLSRTARDFPEYRWTSPENLHFTLKFLGEVSPGRLPEIKDALSGCVAPGGSFELDLGHIGFFPNEIHPNIVWIGVGKGRQALVDLAKNVDDVCCSLGFPKENRPFQPHLTIARVRSDRNCSEAQSHSAVGSKRVPEINHVIQATTRVKSFSLIECQLKPGGPVYRSLADFSLGNHGASGAV